MHDFDLQAYEPNVLCGKVVAATLCALGTEAVVTSPGSRSTPLTFAFARYSKLKVYSVLDERSAAFFAVGIAKRTQKPVVLVCTSGSATGNYLPAIMEAHHSHTPLIVLTADRPPELRDCQSGQTVRQSGIYTHFVRYQTEVSVPKASTEYLKYLRQLLVHAYGYTAVQGGGVVHLNMPFEDPLAPTKLIAEEATLDQAVEEFIEGIGITTDVLAHPSNGIDIASLTERIRNCEHVIVIAGPDNTYSENGFVDAVVALANSMKLPVIADSLSSVRNRRRVETFIDQFEVISRNDTCVGQLKPDLVLWLGDFPTSKALRAAMSRWDCEMIHISQTPENRDPTHSRTVKCYAGFDMILSAINPLSEEEKASKYTQDWLELNQVANAQVEHELGKQADIQLEPLISYNLDQYISQPVDLFIGNSTPIRDMDFFWRGSEHVQKVFTNRGANGIDGLVSTAIGASRSEIPMVALMGELSLFYDVGGLALLRNPHFEGRIVLIVQDNQGGGIFEHLPISQWEYPFEPYFTTPQAVDMRALCTAYGLNYQSVSDFAGMKSQMQSFLSNPESRALCLHIHTNRKCSAKFRSEVLNNAASQLSSI